jgi:RES domain-containing protein
MLSVWWITKQKHAGSAFTGEGARLYGGRWNTPGTVILYTAQSQALAVLEMLVHLDSPELLKAYVLFEVSMEESLVVDLDRSALPKNWRSEPPPARVQAMGDAWVESATSVVLRVPSVIVPGESNFLLNPRHPDFSRVQIGKPIPFQFDSRLSGGR